MKTRTLTILFLLFWLTLVWFLVYTYLYIEEITTNPCDMCSEKVRGMECKPKPGFTNVELERVFIDWEADNETMVG